MIDNLSQIHHPESNAKERTREKENRHYNEQQHYDPKTMYKELEQQRNLNDKLQNQIAELRKKKLFQD